MKCYQLVRAGKLRLSSHQLQGMAWNRFAVDCQRIAFKGQLALKRMRRERDNHSLAVKRNKTDGEKRRWQRRGNEILRAQTHAGSKHRIDPTNSSAQTKTRDQSATRQVGKKVKFVQDVGERRGRPDIITSRMKGSYSNGPKTRKFHPSLLFRELHPSSGFRNV